MKNGPALILAAGLAWAAPDATGAGSPPPASAFASLPQLAMVCLTPDGQKLAWTNDPGGKPVITIFDLATGRDLRQLSIGDYTVRGLDWADNRTLLITITTRRKVFESTVAEREYEFSRTLAVDADGGPVRSLLLGDPEKQSVSGASIVRLHVGKAETIQMSSFDFEVTAVRIMTDTRMSAGRKDQGWVHSLFEVNTRTGRGRKVESGSPYTRQWLTLADGTPAARSEWNPENREFTILARQGRSWKKIYESRGDIEFRLQAMSADGATIFATSDRGGDRTRVWSIPVDGGPISVAYEHPEHDVMHTVDDRFTGAPAGYQIGGLEQSIEWIDPRMLALHKAIARAFPSLRTQVFDRSEDYKRVLVRTEYASNPPVYYLVDMNRGTADTIGETYPALADVALGEMEAIQYPARDGIAIPAYVTTPPGREPRSLPLVVLPHGGPSARDDTGFDYLAQFLATRGYLVLQPQFRGSSGFSAALSRAGDRQWGRGMQDDITDGVKHMIDKGLADPKRICILGASYGGYAALAGAAFTPELYACAVSINGISDLPNMFGFLQRQYGPDSDATRYWRDYVGNPNDEDITRFSPARSADTIQAPVLLIHARNDTVVPFSQSQNFKRLMDQASGKSQLVELAGEDHWLSTSDSRLKMLQAIEGFLATHLRP
ncbi:MAG: S9 family peptidase [Steroidobacteraceae bacterium]|nr:S9 family peptidase [Steroidobacteraceae bacterium]